MSVESWRKRVIQNLKYLKKNLKFLVITWGPHINNTNVLVTIPIIRTVGRYLVKELLVRNHTITRTIIIESTL